MHGHAWVTENSSWNFQKPKIKIAILLNDFCRVLLILVLRIELPIMTALSRSVYVLYSLHLYIWNCVLIIYVRRIKILICAHHRVQYA